MVNIQSELVIVQEVICVYGLLSESARYTATTVPFGRAEVMRIVATCPERVSELVSLPTL